MYRPLGVTPHSLTRNARRTFSTSNAVQSHTLAPGTSLLSGKRCIITGASRGIGAAIAERFAREGGSCTLIGRNESLLGKVKESLDCNDTLPQNHNIMVGDVGEPAFWENLKKSKLKPDILVNAAGITHYSPLVVTSHSLLEEVVRTNLLGTMTACRAVGKSMLGMKGGSIINVASLLGLKGGKGSAAYAASKSGVIGLTRALAAELGERNVRVNVIVPGYIETDMTEAMTPEARSIALNAIPLKRFGHASEVADAAVFLATNPYANNCVLNLDGGLSAT